MRFLCGVSERSTNGCRLKRPRLVVGNSSTAPASYQNRFRICLFPTTMTTIPYFFFFSSKCLIRSKIKMLRRQKKKKYIYNWSKSIYVVFKYYVDFLVFIFKHRRILHFSRTLNYNPNLYNIIYYWHYHLLIYCNECTCK